MDIKQENSKLKSLLKTAKRWMNQEVQSAEKNITHMQSQKDMQQLFSKNLESIVEHKIFDFFPNDVASHFSDDIIDNIMSAELIYYHIINGARVDGTGAIIGYQKVFDTIIDDYLTDGFRSYIRKQKQDFSLSENSLERSLHNCVEKHYTLSAGRIYEILSKIKSGSSDGKYLKAFQQYLESRPYLQKSLLEGSFFIQLKMLIDMEVLGEIRHKGSLHKEQTQKARELYIGDFQNKNCLLYSLSESQSVII